MNKMQTVEVLRTQGIMAKGYGLIPQIIARDQRLTPEAKSIYCYFSSFSGAGFEPVFPSRNLMLKELNMSKDRYYKHLKILIDCNYITVERCKMGNLYSKNIYTLVQLPNAEELVIEGKEVTHVKRPASVKRRLDNKKDLRKERKSAAEHKTTKEKLQDPIQKADQESQSAGNVLRTQLGIDALVKKRPQSKDLVLNILMVIEDMAMSEQITINGSVKKKAAIRHLIESLRMVHIEAMVNNITGSGQKIRNKKAYIQSCIGNILFDTTESLDFSKNISNRQEDTLKEDTEARTLNEEYAKNPDLKELDRQLSEIGLKISKAILSGNELQTKALHIEKERLEEKRESMILGMNATS